MSLLNVNSMPAERSRGCRFAEKFSSPSAIQKNGGIVAGSVQYMSNGLRFVGATDNVAYSTRPSILNKSWSACCGVIEFTPEFAYNDGSLHYFWTTNAARYAVYKHNAANNNVLRLVCGNTTVADISTATYSAYWKQNQPNTLAWSSISGTTYVYLNGTQIASTATAFTAEIPTQFTISNTSSAFIGTMHSFKLFLPSATTQALTAKDCEVLSAGTTYTYWKNSKIIMTGLIADHDPVNYRALDRSGNGYNVLLGNGAGAGTPTKLPGQGYIFNGTSHYMTVPLAAWPGTSGTILIDCDFTSSNPRIFSTDHSSGNNYECRTYLNPGISFQSSIGCNGTVLSPWVAQSYDPRCKRIIFGNTWGYAAPTTTVNTFLDGQYVHTQTTAQPVTTPDLAWHLMRWVSDGSYTTGTIRSLLVFGIMLSRVQVADATFWLYELRNKS